MFKLSRLQYLLIAVAIILVMILFVKNETKRAMGKVHSGLTTTGEAIIDTTAKTLGSHLKSAVAEGGINNALHYCQLNAMPLVKELSEEFDVTISRMAVKFRNNKNEALDIDLMVFNDFQSKLNIDGADQSRMVYLNDHTFFYKPIVMQEFCKACHGTEEFIGEEAWQTISLLYPNDRAIDFETGDLRGIWKIEF